MWKSPPKLPIMCRVGRQTVLVGTAFRRDRTGRKGIWLFFGWAGAAAYKMCHLA